MKRDDGDMTDEDKDAMVEQGARFRIMLSALITHAIEAKGVSGEAVISTTMSSLADFIAGGLKKGTPDKALRELADVFYAMLQIAHAEADRDKEDDA
jgi:hypothetical protein